MIQVSRLDDANVYLNGVSFMGRASKVKLPEVTQATEDTRPLGLPGALALPAGIEAMSATFTWESIDAAVARVAANPYSTVAVQVRSYKSVYGAGGLESEVPVVVHLRGTFVKFPLGEIEGGKAAKIETDMKPTYLKLVIDGAEQLEIDILANVYKVNGEDLLADRRQFLGA